MMTNMIAATPATATSYNTVVTAISSTASEADGETSLNMADATDIPGISMSLELFSFPMEPATDDCDCSLEESVHKTDIDNLLASVMANDSQMKPKMKWNEAVDDFLCTQSFRTRRHFTVDEIMS
ncbi:hypothetical protein ACOMHN_011640 [Nucella lapillus]